MTIKLHLRSAQETVLVHAQRGWQCPECYGIQVKRTESRFGGSSEDRFECQECGAQWGRE